MDEIKPAQQGLDPAELDRMYDKGEEADKPDFAEMRSSLLLIAGEHYNKRNSKVWDRIRTTRDLSNEVKIRLTKNHIGKILRRYSNLITSAAPGTTISPKHDRETQSIKAAELNESVWMDGKERNDWRNMIVDFADDFCGIGEVWTKLYYDQFSGPVVGYEPLLDPATGQPAIDEMGQPIVDEGRPVHQGQIKFEELYAFNVIVEASSKNVKKSPWYCIRKMVPTKDLKKTFPDSAESIQKTEDDTFTVFDVNGYRTSEKGETLVKEWFWRPCAEYPKGHYAIQIKGKILDQGELPEGIFPVVCERFENIQTKKRGIAATKPLRPYQLEINRSASKIAEHQITLGDDKIVMVNGSKLSAGTQLPGIRGVTVTGAKPDILPGRSGAQYAEYMLQQIKEMYGVAEIDDEEEITGNLDPHTLLYRSASQKRKFSRYVKRFENFLLEVTRVYLKMAKYYLTDDAVIAAVGRNEQVNISEFKNTKDQSVEIIIEPQTEDVESKLGRQLSLNHILQYVGTNLDPTVIGMMIKQMPYANLDESFSDMTIDYEMSVNDILMLDRAQIPNIQPSDDHPYLVKRATSRMKQADFQNLHPQIKYLYQQYVDAHIQFANEQKDAEARANAGIIPTTGSLIGVDFYVTDPENPERTRRARFPYDAVNWLAKRLQDQGFVMDEIKKMGPAGIARMGNMAVEPSQGGQVSMAEGPSAEIVSPTA